MSRNIFTSPRRETLPKIQQGASAEVTLETSYEIEIERLEKKLAQAGDNWRAAEMIQQKIDQLKGT